MYKPYGFGVTFAELSISPYSDGQIDPVDVDFLTPAQYTLLTVPAGKNFIPRVVDTSIKAITGSDTAPKYKILADAAEIAVEQDLAANAVGEVEENQVTNKQYGPGTVFKLEVTQAGGVGYTEFTAESIIKGVLSDA